MQRCRHHEKLEHARQAAEHCPSSQSRVCCGGFALAHKHQLLVLGMFATSLVRVKARPEISQVVRMRFSHLLQRILRGGERVKTYGHRVLRQRNISTHLARPYHHRHAQLLSADRPIVPAAIPRPIHRIAAESVSRTNVCALLNGQLDESHPLVQIGILVPPGCPGVDCFTEAAGAQDRSPSPLPHPSNRRRRRGRVVSARLTVQRVPGDCRGETKLDL
mmetsp:Transcript_9238/g.22222  ORF Transcript_9238/g.22222 Transcript_9238/m.22222 type:complete len:219 (-) Transcript_9238:522-1178(-)